MKSIIVILLMITSFEADSKYDQGTHPRTADQLNTPSFKNEKVGAAYTHYIQLKAALVASNASDAKKAATELAALLHATAAIEAAKTAGDIAKANSIEGQRMLFVVLSDQMTVFIKDSKLSSGEVYVQYCPMANNNEGAFWLSSEKEIKNPYFGESMLKCGAVIDTIR